MSRPRNTHDRWALEHNRLKQTWKHRSLAAATAAVATRRTRATQWLTFSEQTIDVSKRGRHHKQRHRARGFFRILHYGMLGSNRTATTWDSVRSTYGCTKSVPIEIAGRFVIYLFVRLRAGSTIELLSPAQSCSKDSRLKTRHAVRWRCCLHGACGKASPHTNLVSAHAQCPGLGVDERGLVYKHHVCLYKMKQAAVTIVPVAVQALVYVCAILR